MVAGAGPIESCLVATETIVQEARHAANRRAADPCHIVTPALGQALLQ
jgi:hypothetical protein